MKIQTIIRWSAGLLSAATLTAAGGSVPANQTADFPTNDKTFKGRVEFINSQEHALKVKGLLMRRTFNLGNNCIITRWDHSVGRLDDLRPGQMVIVGFQDAHGVLAADRVAQQAIQYNGVVKVMDPERRQLVLHTWDRDKKFVLAEDCRIVLHDQENAALSNIKLGDHVTVVYETPPGADVARQISETGISFTGSVVAIDLPHHMISTKGVFGVKQFNLAKDCSIVMNGKLNAPMIDLRPGQRLTINYDEINGVNVANRIAPADNTPETTTAQATP